MFLLLAAVLAASSTLYGSNLLLLLFALLAASFGVDAFMLRRNLQRLEVTRELPSTVVEGAPWEMRLAIANRKSARAAWSLRIAPPGPEEAPHDFPPIFTPWVGPGGRLEIRTLGRVLRRGRHSMGPLVISSRFPFGLLERRLVLADERSLLVWPRLGRLTGRWWQPPHARLPERRGGRSLVPSPFDLDLRGLREFRSGDSPRWIHWKTSARFGKLMVRQYEDTPEQPLAILLDLFQRDAANEEEEARVERAVSLAATLAREACRGRVGHIICAWNGREAGSVAASPSPQLLTRTMDALAEVAAGSEGSLESWLSTLSPLGIGKRTVILISTRPVSPQLARTMTEGGLGGEWVVVHTSREGCREYIRWE